MSAFFTSKDNGIAEDEFSPAVAEFLDSLADFFALAQTCKSAHCDAVGLRGRPAPLWKAACR